MPDEKTVMICDAVKIAMDKGSKVLHWNSRDDQGRTCTSGIYFAVMSIKGGATTTLKLMLMK